MGKYLKTNDSLIQVLGLFLLQQMVVFVMCNWSYFPFLLYYMRLASLWSVSTLGEEFSFLLMLEAGTCKLLLSINFEYLTRNFQPSLGNLIQVTNEMEENLCLAKILLLAFDSWKSLEDN